MGANFEADFALAFFVGATGKSVGCSLVGVVSASAGYAVHSNLVQNSRASCGNSQLYSANLTAGNSYANVFA